MVDAAVSSPWHTGTGALVGALAGAAIGGVSDAGRGAETDRLQAQANAQANDAQRITIFCTGLLRGNGALLPPAQ